MRSTRRIYYRDVVFVVQNAPYSQWRLGRVEEVFSGQDGQVRVIQTSTKGQKLIRPAVPVERRWLGRVRDLERIAEDPELLFGRGEDGNSINLNLFVCKREAYPLTGTGSS